MNSLQEKSHDQTINKEQSPFAKKALHALLNIGPYALIAAITAYISCKYMSPETRNESHDWRMKLAALGIALIVFRFAKAPLKKLKTKAVDFILTRLYFAVLVISCTFGFFNYYQFDFKVAEGFDDYTDITYYYVNTKYLKELGYFRFYAAVLYADKENKNRFASKIKYYRDLCDDQIKPVEVAFAHGKEIKEKYFSKARWKQFRHDANWFLSKKSLTSLRENFFVDHGYNPPMTWAVLGGLLTGSTPIEKVKRITLVDAVFVIGMLIGVAWAFGFEAMLFVFLFWLTTFSGRWPILGHSLLRFEWSSCLVLAMCMLKKEKWLSAGAFLSYSALSRLFPAIFFLAWGVIAAMDIIRERKIPARHVNFALGAAFMLILIISIGLMNYGTETFKESAANLALHNRSYSSHRVGLGAILMYEGETTRAEITQNGGIIKKELAIQDMQTGLRLIGLAALAFVVFYMVRSKKPMYDLVPLAILPLFCVTNAQINYYYVRLILILWHAALLNKPLHRIGLILVLGIDVVTQWAFLQLWDRYAVTVTTSIGMGIYLAMLILWMGFEIVRSFIKKQESAALPLDIQTPPAHNLLHQ